MSDTYTVVCDDDEIRHDGEFSTEAEADRFASWGHACWAKHTLRINRADGTKYERTIYHVQHP